MSLGVSIVICCYNSAERLPQTLGFIAAQRLPETTPWEVLVIDNASSDNTAEVATKCWPISSPAPLRVVREPNPGTGNARFRSFSEARHDILVFLDDDNWIDETWVARAIDFFERHPEAAAVGGPSRAVFESQAPAWFPAVAANFAVGDQMPMAGDITDETGSLLWTAGLSLRRKWLVKLAEEGFRFLSCATPDLPIFRGEDTELCFALRAAGARLYYDSSVGIRHFMPARRTTWPEARRLMRMIGSGGPLLDLYLVALNQRPYQNRPAWKNSWTFFLFKRLRQLLSLIVRHPIACLTQPSGAAPALQFEASKSALLTLWKMRDRYNGMKKRIASSRWASSPC